MNSFSIKHLMIFTIMTFIAGSLIALEDVEINEGGDVTVEVPLEGENIRLKSGGNLTTKKKLTAADQVDVHGEESTNIQAPVSAGGKITIKSGGTVNIGSRIRSGGDVVINSGGSLVINGNIEGRNVNAKSGGDIDVDAEITGRKGIDMEAKGEGGFRITPESSINSPDGNVAISAKKITVKKSDNATTEGGASVPSN